MWIEPIVDRSKADIDSRAAKAFFNVADWARVDGNTHAVRDMITALLGLPVTLAQLSAPGITHFPRSPEINALIENIERVRAGACLPQATGAIPLKRDYLAGNGTIAPDYLAVNAWERNLSLLHDLLPGVAEYAVHCGVAAAGQPRFWQSRFR